MAEAQRLGLINEFAGCGRRDLPGSGAPLRAELLSAGPGVDGGGRIKRAVQAGVEQSLEAGLALERELQQQLFVSEDAREGLRALSRQASAAVPRALARERGLALAVLRQPVGEARDWSGREPSRLRTSSCAGARKVSLLAGNFILRSATLTHLCSGWDWVRARWAELGRDLRAKDAAVARDHHHGL